MARWLQFPIHQEQDSDQDQGASRPFSTKQMTLQKATISKLSIGLFLVILGATLTYSIVATANNGGVFTSSQRDLKTIPSAKKIDLVGKLSAGCGCENRTVNEAHQNNTTGHETKIEMMEEEPSIAQKYAIVLAHTEEDMAWITDIPTKYKLHVMSGNLIDPTVYFKYLPEQFDLFHAKGGLEAAKYLNFIIENYNQLPEKMLFAHAHKSSWHLDDIIKTLPLIPWDDHEYLALASFPVDCWRHALLFDDKIWCEDQAAWYEYMWEKDFGRILNMSRPERVCSPCCATFMVSRKRVLARPLESYVELYRSLMVRRVDSFWSSRIMEYVWHLIFGEPGQIGGLYIEHHEENNPKREVYKASIIEPVALGPEDSGEIARQAGRRGHGSKRYPCVLDTPADDPEEDKVIRQSFGP